MSISGGIKFFNLSSCLGVDGALITASSGNASASNCLDRNPDTYWRSVSSSDMSTETLEITLSETTEIDRLLILDINWKAFNVKYDVSGTWTHFSSVKGMDGNKTNITETVFADSSAYYEFAAVTTGKILISITSTQIADQDKYVSQVITTSELGTFAGYPTVKRLELDRGNRVSKTLSGKSIVMKSIETSGFTMDFKNYPRDSTYNVDFDLIMELHDREDPFLVWLCGGRRGSTYFGYTLRGFRLKDVYVMQITKLLDLSYTKNIYQSSLNTSVVLEEHI